VKVCLPVKIIRATFALKYIILEKKNTSDKTPRGITSKLNHVLEQFFGLGILNSDFEVMYELSGQKPVVKTIISSP